MDDMFKDVVEPSINVGSRKGYTLPLSIAAHALVIAAVVIVPVIATGALPDVSQSVGAFIAPPPPPVAPPPPPPARTERHETTPAAIVNPDAAPTVAPDAITPERPAVNAHRDIDAVERGTGVAPGGGDFGQLFAPPPPPPSPAPTVRVGGAVKEPRKMVDAKPIYPELALRSRVQGVVILEATIDPGGRVQEAKVLRSVPLLDAAALDAVRQWRFSPTLLNGQPVSVIMTVTVIFRLE